MRFGALLALLTVHAAIVLGGVYLMLQEFGRQLERELDQQVERVERDIGRDFDRVRRDVREELEESLPTVPAVPLP